MTHPSHGLGSGGMVSGGMGSGGKAAPSAPAQYGRGRTGFTSEIRNAPSDFEFETQIERQLNEMKLAQEERLAENEVQIIDLNPIMIQEQIEELDRKIEAIKGKELFIQRQMEQLASFQESMLSWWQEKSHELQAARSQIEQQKMNLIQGRYQPRASENKAQEQINITLAIGIGSMINLGIIAFSRMLK
jgi:hypothetical protein